MNKGQLVKLMRRMKLVSQRKVAQQLGISQQAYSAIEKKEYIDKDVLQKILAAIKSSPEELKKLEKLLPPPKKMNKKS